LDITLNWDGDRQLQRKPSHIADDLLILVGAIGHRKRSLVRDPGPPAIPLMELPENVRKLFAKPVAAIQAASRSNVRRRSFPR
jgi:hypothetical protein